MAAPILQIKRGTAGIGGTVPALRPGEPAISLNNYDLFVGIDTTTANNKFFGSHRYWGREDGTNALRVKLVDKDGTNSINLKSPDTLAGVTTYTFPATPVNGQFLKVDSSGVLSWADVTANGSFSNATLTGITTITGTLNVSAESNFTGIATFSNVDINGGAIDGTVIGGSSAAAGTFTQLTYNNSTTSGISTVGSLYVGTTKVLSTEGGLVTLSGIATIDATTKETLETILALEPNDFVSLNVTGISTFGGALNANGNVTLGDTSGDVITVKGTATFEQPVVGTISTATRATLIDTTTAPTGTYYPGLFVSSTGVASTSVYVDAGISYVSNTDTLTLTGDLAVNGGDVTSSASTFNLINANATTVNFAGDATALNLGATTGITTVRNSLRVTNNLYDSTNETGSSGQFLISTGTGIGWTTISGVAAGTISTATRALTVDTVQSSTNSTHYLTFVDSDNVAAAAETVYTDAGVSYNPSTNNLTISGDLAVNGGDVTTTATTATVFDTNATTVTAFGAGTSVQLSAATGITTIRNNLTIGGDLRVNGNDIQASDGNNNITMTSNTLTAFAGDIRVNGNDIQASDGNNNITLTSNTLTTFAGDIRVNGNDIQSSTGTVAITLADNDVTVADDLTVQGNLYVNGSTTQVNTTALTIEDRTLDLGVVNGAAPAGATTWDLGILFNYNASGAKKSAVIWEHGDSRFKFASVLGADTNGTDVNTPQLTVTTFAPIEVASLWVNNACSGGAQEVVGCIGSELNLQNVVVDAGTF